MANAIYDGNYLLKVDIGNGYFATIKVSEKYRKILADAFKNKKRIKVVYMGKDKDDITKGDLIFSDEDDKNRVETLSEI